MILFWEISGGLGNQLYQYSKSLEVKQKYKNIKIIYIYFRRFHYKEHEYPRLNDVLKYNVKIYSGIKIIFLKLFFSKLLSKVSNKFYYHNDNWWYKRKDLENLQFKYCKFGYISSLFQSLPTSFSLNIIKKNFKFTSSSESDYGVLHIRLGDYLNAKNKSEIGLVSNHYYRAVYKKIFNRVKNVLIITNGKSYQIEEILNIKKEDLNIIKSKNDLDDFRLIINSSDIGMPNSTFSIWAAYLSNAKNVYAPNIWVPALPESIKKTKELYLDNWTIV